MVQKSNLLVHIITTSVWDKDKETLPTQGSTFLPHPWIAGARLCNWGFRGSGPGQAEERLQQIDDSCIPELGSAAAGWPSLIWVSENHVPFLNWSGDNSIVPKWCLLFFWMGWIWSNYFMLVPITAAAPVSFFHGDPLLHIEVREGVCKAACKAGESAGGHSWNRTCFFERMMFV